MSTVSETLRGWEGQAVLPFLMGDATKVLMAFLLTGTIRKMSLGRR